MNENGPRLNFSTENLIRNTFLTVELNLGPVYDVLSKKVLHILTI